MEWRAPPAPPPLCGGPPPPRSGGGGGGADDVAVPRAREEDLAEGGGPRAVELEAAPGVAVGGGAALGEGHGRRAALGEEEHRPVGGAEGVDPPPDGDQRAVGEGARGVHLNEGPRVDPQDAPSGDRGGAGHPDDLVGPPDEVGPLEAPRHVAERRRGDHAHDGGRPQPLPLHGDLDVPGPEGSPLVEGEGHVAPAVHEPNRVVGDRDVRVEDRVGGPHGRTVGEADDGHRAQLVPRCVVRAADGVGDADVDGERPVVEHPRRRPELQAKLTGGAEGVVEDRSGDRVERRSVEIPGLDLHRVGPNRHREVVAPGARERVEGRDAPVDRHGLGVGVLDLPRDGALRRRPLVEERRPAVDRERPGVPRVHEGPCDQQGRPPTGRHTSHESTSGNGIEQ